MLLRDCCSPLPICPRAIVEVSSFSTDNVETPAWRQILELIILTAGFSLFSILLLHRHQTCTHTKKHISFSPCTLPIYPLYTSLWHLLLIVRVCVCDFVLTGFILVIVNVNIIGLHHHETFSHQPGWSKSEPHGVWTDFWVTFWKSSDWDHKRPERYREGLKE